MCPNLGDLLLKLLEWSMGLIRTVDFPLLILVAVLLAYPPTPNRMWGLASPWRPTCIPMSWNSDRKIEDATEPHKWQEKEVSCWWDDGWIETFLEPKTTFLSDFCLRRRYWACKKMEAYWRTKDIGKASKDCIFPKKLDPKNSMKWMSWKIFGWEEHPGLRRQVSNLRLDMFEMRWKLTAKKKVWGQSMTWKSNKIEVGYCFFLISFWKKINPDIPYVFALKTRDGTGIWNIYGIWRLVN